MAVRHEISAGGIVYRKISPKVGESHPKHDVVWLICQHSQHKGWVFPKGLVGDTKENEPYEEAALREVEEEGGIKAAIIAPLPTPVEYVYRWHDDTIGKTVHYYLMEYVSGNPEDHDDEMDKAEFVSEAHIKKMLTYNTDKVAFEEALKLFKQILI